MYDFDLQEKWYKYSDAVFIDSAIEQEEDTELQEALKDLKGFIFGW